MNTIILIKLIAAHLTGDFLFQSDRMCANKFSNNTTAKYKVLILHAFIQAALAYAFVSQWNCWIIPVVIGVSHFIIDYAKSMSKRNDLISLVWDQLAFSRMASLGISRRLRVWKNSFKYSRENFITMERYAFPSFTRFCGHRPLSPVLRNGYR